uniref:TsaA-like domain-containing protein n=1 Tax=Fibrocapsa japonica TaxID=94617 RepID=A0A6U1NSP7_9STRA
MAVLTSPARLLLAGISMVALRAQALLMTYGWNIHASLKPVSLQIRYMSSGNEPELGMNAKRRRSRKKPQQFYTEKFESPEKITFEAIAVVRSPYKERFGTPRQPVVVDGTLGNKAQIASLVFKDDQRIRQALYDLEEFEYCWIISHFHLNKGWRPMVRPPRNSGTVQLQQVIKEKNTADSNGIREQEDHTTADGGSEGEADQGPADQPRKGLFSTRSPHRPNQIGLSACQIHSVDPKKGILNVIGHDMLDGTPILDVKPYVPYCDAFPNARAGWLDEIDREHIAGPDHLGYWPPPQRLQGEDETAQTLGESKEAEQPEGK